MAIDIAAIRADAPACEEITHFNNCGSSLPPNQVVDAVVDYVKLEAATGGYEAAEAEAEALSAVYTNGAELLGCAPDELAFVSGAAEAWWRAFSSVPLQPGDRILTGTSEYQANGYGLLQARERGIEVQVIDNDSSGTIDLDLLADAIDERVKLICLTSIALSNGGVQPAAAVGKIANDAGVLYLLDACQAVGQMVVDVNEIGCDFLAFTGRKFMRGPRGTGMLFARSSVLDQLLPSTFIDGASAVWTSPDTYELQPGAKRFEFGEYPYGAKKGLGVALGYANEVGMGAIEDRVSMLSARLRQGLSSTEDVKVEDTGDHLSGIVTFSVNGRQPADVVALLRNEGINTGAPLASFAQWDMAGRGLASIVRAGVHYFNTEAEVDKLVDEVSRIAAQGGSS